MKLISVVVLVSAMLVLSASHAPNRPGTLWLFELRESEQPAALRLPGSLSLDSAASINARRAQAEFTLGTGSVGAVLAPLVPDHCVSAAGTAELSRRRDSVFIELSPHARDCGLIARGVVQSDTVSGSWYQPRFSGYAAQGPFVMWRQR